MSTSSHDAELLAFVLWPRPSNLSDHQMMTVKWHYVTKLGNVL